MYLIIYLLLLWMIANLQYSNDYATEKGPTVGNLMDYEKGKFCFLFSFLSFWLLVMLQLWANAVFVVNLWCFVYKVMNSMSEWYKSKWHYYEKMKLLKTAIFHGKEAITTKQGKNRLEDCFGSTLTHTFLVWSLVIFKWWSKGHKHMLSFFLV